MLKKRYFCLLFSGLLISCTNKPDIGDVGCTPISEENYKSGYVGVQYEVKDVIDGQVDVLVVPMGADKALATASVSQFAPRSIRRKISLAKFSKAASNFSSSKCKNLEKKIEELNSPTAGKSAMDTMKASLTNYDPKAMFEASKEITEITSKWN